MAEFRRNKRKSEASERISEDDSRTAKKSSVQRPEKDENAENAEAEERRLRVSTIFNPAPRPAFAPWHHNFIAPTPPYDNQETCPIDWSKVKIEHSDAEHIKNCQQAYELRRPWDKQPLAWEPMADKIGLLSAKAGKKETISSEGGRKRFIKANKAVFKLTHVYFPESSLGLEEENIPSWKELKPLLETLGEVPAPKKRTGTRNSLEYGGTAVQLVVSPPGHKGSVSRFVTKEVMDQLSIQENHFFPYSLDNFDRWYTSIFQGLRHTFPRRLYRLEPWNDSYMHLDNGTPSIAMSDLFETYRLSQEMGTTEVSDMILDEIAQSFKRENELVNKQDDVGVTMQDCDNTIRTLSFDVHHLSLLWECTEHNDPTRKLVLEILYRWKGIVEDTIEDEEQESKVGAGFMHDWKAFMDRPDFRQCDVAEKFFHEGRKYTLIDPKKIGAPGKGMCSNLGQEQGDLQEFCAQYHNHIGYGLDCFRSQPESTKLIPENLDDPKIVKFLLNSVE